MSNFEPINYTLQRAIDQMSEEIGTLVGEELQCGKLEGSLAPAAEVSRQFRNKTVLSQLQVSGDQEGEALLLTGMRTAIILGGKLIMLPTHELAARIKALNFDGELADAFGEIANIVAGSFSGAFLEGAPARLHFKRTEVKALPPPSGPNELLSGLAAGDYYQVRVALKLNQEEVGDFWFLFPPAVLGLVPEPGAEAPAAPPARQASGADPLVLVVAEDSAAGATWQGHLEKAAQPNRRLGPQEDFRKELQGLDVGAAFLVMAEVDDRGFAVAIKLRSILQPSTPLILAGPGWTKKSVLQAIKFGACDILMTPASAEEILQKVRTHLPPKR